MLSGAPPPTPMLRPDGLYLEIPTLSQPSSQPVMAIASAQWRMDLNQICLDAVLPWLAETYETKSQVWQHSTLASISSVVNGVAVTCGAHRFVLIPTVEIDQSALAVPQEWVDIPNWSADYYIAVQIDFNEGFVHLWGYTTHHQLKTVGEYDPEDRTYCLTEEQLLHNVSLIQMAQQLCPDQPRRTAIAPLPTLSRAQLNALVDRLSHQAIAFPRLAVPFQTWAGLIQSEGWRQRLYERRQGLSSASPGSIPQWLQQGISELGIQIGWQLVPLATQGMRSRALDQPINGLRRELAIAGQAYELRIFPNRDADQTVWRFELRHLTASSIPPGFKLRLLTDELQPFENNEDTAAENTTQLYVDVLLEPGEGVIWEIEPTPEDYVQEILCF